METVKKHFFSDMGVMLGRSMRHILRSMDTIITVTIMPIAFMLLFVYVFGGAIQTGTDNYVNYLLPGILLITIASVAFAANPYASQLFGYTNDTASTIITALVIILLGAVVNLTGIRRLAIVANVGFVAEIIGTIVFGAWFLIHGTHHGLGVLFHNYGAGGDHSYR